MFIEIPKFVLLLVSLFGYFFFFSRILKLKFEFLPFFTICLLASLIYFFALFGLMEAVTYAVYFGGIALFVIFAGLRIFNKKYFQIASFDPSAVFFFIFLCFVFFLITRELTLTIWDEYSHWGLIAKEFFYNNRLTRLDTALYAVEYPVIIPVFQYFIFKALRFSEANMFFANTLIPISVIVAALSAINRKSFWLKAILVISFLLLSTGLASKVTCILSLYAEPVLTFTFLRDHSDRACAES